jgi:PAS domain S-box-containing protein
MNLETIGTSLLNVKSCECCKAFDEMPVVWFRFDEKGTMLECFGGGLKRLGVKSQEAIGRNVFEDYPQLEAPFRTALAGKATHYEVCGENDGLPWAFFTHIGFDSSNGKGAVGFSVDVTEHMKSEEAFRHARHRLESIFRAAPTGIGVVVNRVFTEVNEQVCRVLGFSQEELLGKNARFVYPNDYEYNKVGQIKYKQIREKGIGVIETRWKRRDGSVIDVLLSSSPIDPKDYSHGVTFCVWDITERKEAERERIKLLKNLEEAVQIRDDFLSIASHELRTPLTALQLKVQTLKRLLTKPVDNKSINERLPRVLQIIEEQIASSARLINNMLDMSRIKAGHLELNREEVDLGEIVKTVIDRHEEEAIEAGCKIEFFQDCSVVGYWDRVRLEQVVTNLIFNAFKYGSGNPIEITVQGKERKAQLIVCDHGIGIDLDDQKRIFKCFEQAVPRGQFGGLGLGLWIVSEIVRAFEGSVSVDSCVGKGAAFTIELPCQVEWGYEY